MDKSIDLKSLTASQFANYYGLSDLDKSVLKKKYAEEVKSEQDWITELQDKIDLKKVTEAKAKQAAIDFAAGNFLHKGLPISKEAQDAFDKEKGLSEDVIAKRATPAKANAKAKDDKK